MKPRRELLQTSITDNRKTVARVTTRAEGLLWNLASGNRAHRRVINATGDNLHTNLGRAPLSQAARDALQEASGYGTLNMTPSPAGVVNAARAEELLIHLTEAEAARSSITVRRALV